MKYKMICLDMDGTLLTSDKRISEKNKEYLKKIKDKGVKIAVCTGRLLISAKFFANLIGEEVDVIASNGAMIIDKNENEIYQSHLGLENGLFALEIMKKYNIYPHFYSKDTIFTEKFINSSIFYQKYNEAAKEERYKVKFQLHFCINIGFSKLYVISFNLILPFNVSLFVDGFSEVSFSLFK